MKPNMLENMLRQLREQPRADMDDAVKEFLAMPDADKWELLLREMVSLSYWVRQSGVYDLASAPPQPPAKH